MFRSAPPSETDKQMTEQLGREAVLAIVNNSVNKMIYTEDGAVLSTALTPEMGGRVLDLEGQHQDEMILANMATAGVASTLQLEDPAVMKDTFAGVTQRYRKLETGQRFSLTHKEMKSLLWTLSVSTTPTEENRQTFSDISRMVKRLKPVQKDQLKRLAGVGYFGRNNVSILVEKAFKQHNVYIGAVNALIARAGGLAGALQDMWQPGVNIVAMKSLAGSKALEAAAFVEMNNKYAGVFGPYQIRKLELGQSFEVNGAKVDVLVVPADLNIGRPRQEIYYFGPSVTPRQAAMALKQLEVEVNEICDYGPGKEKAGEKQPERYAEYMEIFPDASIISASPINKDGLQKMLVARGKLANFLKEGLYAINRRMIEPLTTWIIDTLSCTSNAMIPWICFVDDTWGITSGEGETIHAATDSNEFFPGNSGRARTDLDKLRGDSISDNIIWAGTNAAENLFKIKPELKGKFAIDAERVGTLAGSAYTMTFELKKAPKNMEEIKNAFRDFAQNRSGGVVQFWEGKPGLMSPLESLLIVGNAHSSIVDSYVLAWDPATPTRLKVKGLYDNQGAAPAQMIWAWSQWMGEQKAFNDALAEIAALNVASVGTASATTADGGKNKADLSNRLVVSFAEIGKEDVAIVGGKGANLGELTKFLGDMIPGGFVLTSLAFKHELEKNFVEYQGARMTLGEYIMARTKGLNYKDETERNKASFDIKDMILNNPMPRELEEEIIKWYQDYCQKKGKVVPMAVRSSATAEDLPEASFAGQQETFLNVIGNEAILLATKKCIASMYGQRAMFYRDNQGIGEDKASLCVVFQEMAKAKVAGVGFGVDLKTGGPGITINGNWGLGETVVGGTVTPDSYSLVFDAKTGRPTFFERTLGSKLHKIVKTEQGTVDLDTTPEERAAFCVNPAQAEKVGYAVKVINEHYEMPMDVEWVVDEDDQVKIVQARPVTTDKTGPHVLEMDFLQLSDDQVPEVMEGLAVRGLEGAPRAAIGKVVKIQVEEVKNADGTVDKKATSDMMTRELDKVKEGDVLVAPMTSPDMVSAMKRSAAIVTDEGGITCHAAIVARELEKAYVVGTGKATQVLQDGETVLVDSQRGIISRKLVTLTRTVQRFDFNKWPELKTKLCFILSEPDLAAMLWKFSNYQSFGGFGLVRKEHVDLTQTLMHPQGGLEYDRFYDPNFKDETRKQWIKEHIIDRYGDEIKNIIEGYPTFQDFYKDKLKKALVRMASAQVKGQRIKWRAPDFKSNEFRNLKTGAEYEPDEGNPMAGNRGAFRILTPQYEQAFRLDCQAVREARKLRSNIDIMIPVVRTPDELRRCVVIMAEEGLFDGEEKPEIGMMTELSVNVYMVDEFYQMLSDLAKKYGTSAFISIGSNDLTQFTLGAGRDNEKMIKFANVMEPAILRSVEVIIKTAKKYGISTGICGEAPSKFPEFAAFLVECGIDSISVSWEVYEKLVYAIAEAEKKVAGRKFDPRIAGWEYPSQLEMGSPKAVVAEKVDASEVIKSLKVHPLSLIKKEGENAAAMVVAQVKSAIMEKVKTVDPSTPIIYTTDDNLNSDYKELVDGAKEEGFDENPYIGFAGLAKVVDPGWESFFRWQLQGLKQARELSGRQNIGIRFDLVTVPSNVKRALEIMKEEGLEPGKDGLMVGMEIGKAGNGMVLDQYLDLGINFFSENPRRFLSYMLPIDPTTKNVDIPLAHQNQALTNARKIWTNFAEKHGVPMVSFTEAEGVLVAVAEASEVKAEAAVSAIPAKLLGTLMDSRDAMTAAGSAMYDLQAHGFGNMLNAVAAAEVKPVMVFDAASIIKNPATLTTMKRMKAAGVKVFAWALNEQENTVLKSMEVYEVATIVVAADQNELAASLKASDVSLDQVGLLNSGEAVKEAGQFGAVVNLGTPDGKAESVNLIPLAAARALAGVMKGDNEVVKEFTRMAAQETRAPAELTDLEQQIASMPAVQATGDEAAKQAEFDKAAAQIESVVTKA